MTSRTKKKVARDPRLPVPGAVIERIYKGKTLRVAVLEIGFRLGKREFSSLSALARHITGAPSINGPLFFRLGAPAARKRKTKAAMGKKPSKRDAAERPAPAPPAATPTKES